MLRLEIDGKFFRAGSARVSLRAVTYGPFPGGWPEDFGPDFQRIRQAGFHAIRLYCLPDGRLLDAAAEQGLWVFGMPVWAQATDFLRDGHELSRARVQLAEAIRQHGSHPAWAGVYVANEIPADLVRWMGPLRVREALDGLILLGKQLAPHLLWAYANYPSTEYLEPEHADFTAFNVYLETAEPFRKYLRRLHHIAGDRPLVISEFGMDGLRHGAARQAEVLSWALTATEQEHGAGFTVFAWSDRWQNGSRTVEDWAFGLTDREGQDKPALVALAQIRETAGLESRPGFSVIVCTRNGAGRIGLCLRAVEKLLRPQDELIVVDDGSTDGTAKVVAGDFPGVRLIRLAAGGLSAARNAGAAAAKNAWLAFTDDDCEPDEAWLDHLAGVFSAGYDAAGGPNLPPLPLDGTQAIVASAPGAPSHVMLSDEEAEHLPGCNLAVTKVAFEKIGGFDPIFHTAGDDVDFCWRLREAGYRLGFSAGAFVWHHRRPSLRAYLKQQIGYGMAERLLISKHPEKFTKGGDARWEGFVYEGGPIRVGDGSIIYHGPMGLAGYQSLVTRMQPTRPLMAAFATPGNELILKILRWLQPRLRQWKRCQRWRLRLPHPAQRQADEAATREFSVWSTEGKGREDFLRELMAEGWQPADDTASWDLEKNGSRLQLTTELTDGTARRTLFRQWGGEEISTNVIR
jgi:GT2 family glycosyltransferase